MVCFFVAPVPRWHISSSLVFLIFFQYKSERSSLGSPQDWKERPDASTPVQEGGALNGKSSNGFGVKSLDQHMGALNLLESK